jgi:hypothetical protein
MKILDILSWIGDFLVDTVILFLWLLAMPFLITAWCFYHPVQAKIYFVNALPLLVSNWAACCVLLVMILVGMLAFDTARKFSSRVLKTALAVGVLFYIIAIFQGA